MSKNTKIVLIVVVLVIIIAAVSLYNSAAPSAPVQNNLGGSRIQPVPQPAAPVTSMSNPTDISSSGIKQDAAAIDAQVNALSAEDASSASDASAQ